MNHFSKEQAAAKAVSEFVYQIVNSYAELKNYNFCINKNEFCSILSKEFYNYFLDGQISFLTSKQNEDSKSFIFDYLFETLNLPKKLLPENLSFYVDLDKYACSLGQYSKEKELYQDVSYIGFTDKGRIVQAINKNEYSEVDDYVNSAYQIILNEKKQSSQDQNEFCN